MIRDRIGDRIKAERERRNWTQGDLAQRSGISQAYISQVERGARQRLSGDVLQQLAGAFGTTVDALMGHAPITPDYSRAPIELLQGIWDEAHLAQLITIWPALPDGRRHYWWEQAQLQQTRRAEIAEAVRVVREINAAQAALEQEATGTLGGLVPPATRLPGPANTVHDAGPDTVDSASAQNRGRVRG